MPAAARKKATPKAEPPVKDETVEELEPEAVVPHFKGYNQTSATHTSQASYQGASTHGGIPAATSHPGADTVDHL